jgi:hypothetical protein
MILIFALLVLILLGIGTYQSQLRRATLHWGRVIAGLGRIRYDIDKAKTSDPFKAAELLGRSVHQRGFQDAITPPWLTKLTLLYWPICVATYTWGFFVLPWYIALLWPVAFVVGKRILTMMLPRPDSDSYRRQLVASLEARSERFRRVGDDMRFAAARCMIDLLHQHAQNV